MGRGLISGLLALIPSLAMGQVRPADPAPVAVQGGVLAVEMAREGDQPWPDTLPVRIGESADSITGLLAWIGPQPAAVSRHWTMADEGLDVRPASRAPDAQAERDAGVLVLLVAMPRARVEELRIEGVRVRPRWLAITMPEPDAGLPPMPRSPPPALDQPDPVAPSEWFRWWLMADASRARPPEPAGDAVSRLLAMQRAQLWQAGLERVERVSPGVAAALRDRLTACCRDPRQVTGGSVAAWIARADDLATLLSLLLDGGRSDAQVMEAALTWLRATPPLTVWMSGDDGRSVRISALNPGGEEVIAAIRWAESPHTLPLPLRVPARGSGQQTMERPAELLPDLRTGLAAPVDGTLLISSGDWTLRMSIPRTALAARPPGVPMGLLLPSLRLADAQRLRIEPPPSAWRTTASLRRHHGAWEVFVECLRPALSELDELEVLVGQGDGPPVRVLVHEHGEPRIEGAQADAPQVRRGRFADRWRCVIRMPDGWPGVADPTGRWMRLGVARSPAGVGSRQTATMAVPAWQPLPLLTLDASRWWSPSDAAPEPLP